MKIDLNCDLGEGFPDDEEIIPSISSANIACGYHAGSDLIIKKTIEVCLKNKVAIGAHPGYADIQNFGRTEHQLSYQQYYDLITEQLTIFKKQADLFNVKIHHVKPHGALYNQAAKNKHISAAIAKAIKNFDDDLIVYGLSGSYLISEAEVINLKTASEVFADRTYQDDGSLTPRAHSNALITDETIAIKQVLKMIKDKTVTSVNKIELPIKADTICIHGDGSNAVNFAKRIFGNLKENHIELTAI